MTRLDFIKCMEKAKELMIKPSVYTTKGMCYALSKALRHCGYYYSSCGTDLGEEY